MFDRVRIIDLSVPLSHQAASEPLPASIRYIDHAGEGLAQMQQFFGIRPEDLVYSHGQGWAIEEISAITHTGTHVDAPYHYGATSEDKPARTIDQVPLEWCFAPGVVIDVRHIPDGAEITVADFDRRSKKSTINCGRAISCYCKRTPTSESTRRHISRSPAWGVTGRCGWSSKGCA